MQMQLESCGFSIKVSQIIRKQSDDSYILQRQKKSQFPLKVFSNERKK